MPETRKTITTTTRIDLDFEADDLEAMIREKFDLPIDTKFQWHIDRYEDFSGVTITHETSEVIDA